MNRLPVPANPGDIKPLSSLIETAPCGQNRTELSRFIGDELNVVDQYLAGKFWSGGDVVELVMARAWAVEQLLLLAWDQCVTTPLEQRAKRPCLVAVGGFGRGELHPHSDVDILVLVDDVSQADEQQNAAIEALVQVLWDAGFYLGHSVQTIGSCIASSREDVVTATSLMESRLLDGPAAMFTTLRDGITIEKMWNASEFFSAKFSEQQERHARYNDTAYNLEPNIKEGPGGLRDIQMISWVAKRHFGARTLHGLVEHNFLTETEYDVLETGQRLLWRVRFALHLLAGRGEDRLLFDFQREVAARFGYSDEENNLAVEQFMQVYYRNVMQLERLNERLLQLFQEELLFEPDDKPVAVTPDFASHHGFLEVNDENLFENRPAAIMELFVLLARDRDLRGVRASTIRLIRNQLHLIDDAFRADQDVNQLFLKLLSQPRGIYTQLNRMNRYGVLAEYLPAFSNIVGRMQYDLFHVYTVDQHTLFVVRNLRRFAYGKYKQEFPHARSVFRRIERPALLYLAAIFHDIAKGRGGDHSELGAIDARDFCAGLDLAESERALVSWLVENHLVMSRTAQRKDLSDPAVIQDFAQRVKTMDRLDHLYLLTMADISGTSPKLWNNWKNSLLWELYVSAGHALRRGLKNPVERQTRIRERRSRTLSRLLRAGRSGDAIGKLWDSLPEHAFLRLNASQMEWATTSVIDSENESGLIAVRAVKPQGISEVLVCVPDYEGLIASVTSVFEEMRLNILAARILTTEDERSFDLFQVSDRNNNALLETDARSMEKRLLEATSTRGHSVIRQKMSRQMQHFDSQLDIRFSAMPDGRATLMEIECNDQPGLLSRLASAMTDSGVQIHDARIATFGERVEDTFVITDFNHRALSEDSRELLKQNIEQSLAMSAG